MPYPYFNRDCNIFALVMARKTILAIGAEAGYAPCRISQIATKVAVRTIGYLLEDEVVRMPLYLLPVKALRDNPDFWEPRFERWRKIMEAAPWSRYIPRSPRCDVYLDEANHFIWTPKKT